MFFCLRRPKEIRGTPTVPLDLLWTPPNPLVAQGSALRTRGRRRWVGSSDENNIALWGFSGAGTTARKAKFLLGILVDYADCRRLKLKI